MKTHFNKYYVKKLLYTITYWIFFHIQSDLKKLKLHKDKLEKKSKNETNKHLNRHHRSDKSKTSKHSNKEHGSDKKDSKKVNAFNLFF